MKNADPKIARLAEIYRRAAEVLVTERRALGCCDAIGLAESNMVACRPTTESMAPFKEMFRPEEWGLFWWANATEAPENCEDFGARIIALHLAAEMLLDGWESPPTGSKS
jgi:hypothetical protein